ncbi:hypothetical protein C453_13271 [Haloferax elongans ATCC BAA-1513]|uniref:Uncharacterized protein n=1 Tax=Haloferax elongans ATCC BAA-1513 TaxID=1230453 RepID=M0HGX8_HALEO|nr:hypothetical protein [Haloferax elongans]ELZ82982.1 hypothetical protein C453_13271 [Haloferax elongans ATCC BAA-1513]
MTPRRIFLALLVVSAVLPAVVGPATAGRPPVPVCGVCSDSFSGAAYDAGVNLTVESSNLHVRVDESGTGHWTARTVIDETAAATFRDDPALLESVVRESFDGHRQFVDDPRNLSMQMDGQTVVVTFDVPEMTSRGYGNVLLVDYFNADGDTRHVYVDADRFTVSGPEGTVLVNDPPGADTENGTATWSTEDGDYQPIDYTTYLAFGPNNGLGTQAAAYASIAADSAPYLLSDLLYSALVPTLLMLFGVLAVQRYTRRRDATVDSCRTLAAIVAGLGIVWIAGLVALGMFSGGLSAVSWTLGLQFVALGAIALRRPEVFTFRRLVAATVGPPVVVAAAVSIATPVSELWPVPSSLSFGVIVTLFLPFGYAARRDRGTRLLALAIVAAPTMFVMPMLPIGGFGPGFMMILLVSWVLLTLAVGTLVYRLGWALGDGGESGPSATVR